MKLAYVDACVWITLVEGLSGHRAPVRSALESLAQEGWTFCTSDAVRLEVLIGPLRRQQAQLLGMYRDILEVARELHVPSNVFSDALPIAEAEGLRAMDAVHVAIAAHHRCERFVTTDPHFKDLRLIAACWVEL